MEDRLVKQTLERQNHHRDVFYGYVNLAYDNMVHSQIVYRHQGRVIYCQHGLCIDCVNRIAIHWRLLVEFSCNSYLISTLRFNLVTLFGLCTKWLLQYSSYCHLRNFLLLSTNLVLYQVTVLDISIIVFVHASIIVLQLHQYYLTRLVDSGVFRVVTIFKISYFILLGFFWR